MSDMKQLGDAVVKGDRDEAKRLTQELLDAGKQPQDIVEQGLVPGMAIVGDRFKKNEVFVPEMLIAARAMKEAMSLIEPLLVKQGIKPKHTVIVGTVQGDLHDIGKNLVAMMLKGANFGVVDLGTNVPAEQFVAAAKEHDAHVGGAVGPADNNDAVDEVDHRRPARSGPGERQGDDWRRADHADVCGRDRCRRLCARCGQRGRQGARTGCRLTAAGM